MLASVNLRCIRITRGFKTTCGGPPPRSGLGWLLLWLFLDLPGGSHKPIGLSIRGLSYDSFGVWSPVKEGRQRAREQTLGPSFLLSNASGCFLFPNFPSVHFLQCSWFPADEIRRDTICCHLKRTRHCSMAKMGPWSVESSRG